MKPSLPASKCGKASDKPQCVGRRTLAPASHARRQAQHAITPSHVTLSHNHHPQEKPTAITRAADDDKPSPSTSSAGYNSPTPSETSRKRDSTTPSFTDTASITEPAQIPATVDRSVSPTKRRRGSVELSSSPNPNSTVTLTSKRCRKRIGSSY